MISSRFEVVIDKQDNALGADQKLVTMGGNGSDCPGVMDDSDPV
jgi:hypothetical protein